VTFSLDSNNLFGLGITTTNRYTYSKSKDNGSSTFTDGYQGGFALGNLDPFNPSLDYGYSDFDVRHRFVSSFIYDIPVAKHLENKFLKSAFGGIQLTGIVNIQSGTPFTIYDCTNATQTTCVRFTPTAPISFGGPSNLVSTGDPNTFIYTDLRNQTPSTYDDTSRYPTGTAGTEAGPFPSNMPARNSFRGPGFWNVTLGLYKNISFSERMRVQLRAETFNVFNHANLVVNPNSFDFSATPYVVANKVGSRNVQLAAKFIF
jgi:hypothetical protein